MKRNLLFSKISFGLVLIFVSLIGWKTNGSVFFIALLLLGLIKFLGAVIYIVSGKTPFKNLRNTVFILFLGAIVGFIVFDLPAIYLFKVWAYQIGIPNPFSNFFLYIVQSLGWGAFLIVFYDSYKLLNLAIDKNFHNIGLTHGKNPPEKLFSVLGIFGIILFLISVILAILGFVQNVWPATLGAFGVWFILENIEFRKNGITLLSRLIKGDLSPMIAILAGSLALGFIFEYFNIISPKQHWVYYGLPFQNINILGIPIFLLISWAWMYIIFLSIYEIIYKNDNLWQ